MKKCSTYIVLVIFILGLSSQSYAFQSKQLLDSLDRVIAEKEVYRSQKYHRILALKKEEERFLYAGSQQELYLIYEKLFNEYRSFQYDSAYVYLDKAKQVAKNLGDVQKIYDMRIKEGFVLLSGGMFKESIDLLETVQVAALDTLNAFNYYNVLARTYFDLANYTADNRFSIGYIQKGNALLDKALPYVTKADAGYWSTISLRYLMSRDWTQAEESYKYWIAHFKLEPDAYAIATSSLAYVYSIHGYTSLQITYLSKAAITDIKNGITETVALQNLAGVLFKEQDLKRANSYITLAMDDANFYNAKHRKTAISDILPIIEKSQLLNIEKQKQKLTITVIVLGVLAVTTIVFIIIIIKQLKARTASRKMLAASNEKLQELNADLKETDRIKEEYIAYFLKTSAGFIQKIDTMQKITHQKVVSKRTDELIKSLKRFSVKNERSELLQQFDEVFLTLFPTFKVAYGKLFLETDEALFPEEGLNTELRIFALYRLGVQDSHQVAEFLDLSVSTIYTYKARVKSRALDKEGFDARIMDIKQLS